MADTKKSMSDIMKSPQSKIGMVCGGIKHAFLWQTGNPFNAEPFIRHFLKRYTAHFGNDKKAFRNIARKTPSTWR
jgi:hypothetical protein